MGPVTYAEYCEMPECDIRNPVAAYEAGIKGGRRYERADKLLEVATAAMQGMLANPGIDLTYKQIQGGAYMQAEILLAEADRRRDEK